MPTIKIREDQINWTTPKYELKHDWNDITILPAIISDINSRAEVNIKNSNEFLPLIVSPMDTVIDENNYELFYNQNLMVCLPRGVLIPHAINTSGVFHSMSLEHFEIYVRSLENGTERKYQDILVDVANGHMKRLLNITERFIKVKANQRLMIGNIAQKETYELYARLGVDFIRVGIGSGSRCTTSANVAIHNPLMTLCKEIREIKDKKGYKTAIVGDGGFHNISDIIKGLLFCDYIMCGSIFNKCLESCGKTTIFGLPIDNSKEFWYNNFPKLRKYMKKSYRGMSTKEVQKTWNKEKLRTSEGISKKNNVEYKLSGWIENFGDYLSSTLSYCGTRTLEEFRKEAEFVYISRASYERFNK